MAADHMVQTRRIGRLRLLIVVVFALGALTCVTTPRPAPVDSAALPSTTMRGAVDWSVVGAAAFDDLAAYLRIDTVNPPGNEGNGADFLAALLNSHGIASEQIDHGDNRRSLIARLPATTPSMVPGQGAICLVSHIDVVTSEEDRWPVGRGPRSGAMVDEPSADGGTRSVYGRGAIDMKGMGIMEVHAMVALKNSGLPRTRDIVLVAVADEEVKSAGIDAIVSDEHWPKVNCTHAINEGGIGLKDAIVEGQTVFAISVGERGVLWSRVIAEGPTGHGSTPIPGRAPEKLLTAMNRLNAWHDTPTIHPALYELLAEVGREAGGATGFIMERPFLVDAFVKDRLQQQPTTKAITNDTVHLTGFWGANSPNVVPSMVWAQYDVRLLPGTTPAAMEAELKALLADIPGVRLEVVESKEANESPWDDPLYESLRRNVVDGDARTVAGPIISPGFTDSIVLRRRGVRAYGVIPIVVSAAESATMHGDAERVSLKNIVRGTRALTLSLADVVISVP